MNHSFCILLCKKILLNRTRARSIFLWHNLQNSVRIQRNGHAPAVTKPTMVIGLRLVPWCCMRSCRECWAISSRATTQISLLDAHPMKYRRWLSPGFVLWPFIFRIQTALLQPNESGQRLWTPLTTIRQMSADCIWRSGRRPCFGAVFSQQANEVRTLTLTRVCSFDPSSFAFKQHCFNQTKVVRGCGLLWLLFGKCLLLVHGGSSVDRVSAPLSRSKLYGLESHASYRKYFTNEREELSWALRKICSANTYTLTSFKCMNIDVVFVWWAGSHDIPSHSAQLQIPQTILSSLACLRMWYCLSSASSCLRLLWSSYHSFRRSDV